MSSLFDAATADAALQRIQDLSPDAAPQWGTMGPAQMLAHCAVGLELATGQREMKRMFMGRILGGIVKKVALSPKPFKQGLPTGPDFLVKDERDFDAEQERLLALVRAFQEGGTAGVTSVPHPFFGKMSPEQWDFLMWKHLDHHLGQFGV